MEAVSVEEFQPRPSPRCCDVVFTPGAGTPMWAQSARSRVHATFSFRPHFCFLLTQQLGIPSVFFSTSKSPKPQSKGVR